MKVPEQTPRKLSPSAERALKRAHGFMLLFGRIWAAVGGVLIVIFGVSSFAMPGMGLGVVIATPFLVIGAVLVELSHRRVRRDRLLLENGRLATGAVVENVVDYKFRKNHKYSNRITCRCVDPTSAREYTATLRSWEDDVVASHPVGLELPMIFDEASGRAIAPSIIGVEFTAE